MLTKKPNVMPLDYCYECGAPIPSQTDCCSNCGMSLADPSQVAETADVANEPTPSLTFVEAVVSCFSAKYFTFSGRARRSEFLYFNIFNILTLLFFCLVSTWLRFDVNIQSMMVCVGLIYFVVSVLPFLGVLVRRLHDIGHSGLFAFLLLVPVFAPLLMLLCAFRDSVPETNDYGPSPKYK